MDNYTKFPNDILDALIAYHLSGSYVAVVLYIVRKVNGWGKPSDAISVSKMAKQLGYSRRWIIGVVSDLEKMSILSVERNGSGRLSEMRVNDPEKWSKPVNCTSHVNRTSQGTVLHRGVNSTSHLPVNCTSQEPVNCTSHTKERKIIKDTIQKKEPSAPFSDDELRAMGWLE